MRRLIWLIVIAAVLTFIAGCGPGQPFEIEGRGNTRLDMPTQVAVDTEAPTPPAV